jgi:predicted transcriptional regulator
MSEFLDENEKKVLELDIRRNIYGIVKKFAGCHFREIERKSGLSTGSVKYHLSYLAKHHLVKEEKDGSYVRYFPREFKTENRKLLGFLRQKTIRNILLHILTNKDCSHEQIVDAVKVAPSTASWHLKKLEESNIVSSVKKGRIKSYTILPDRDEIISLLITYQESFLDAMVDRVVEMWER